MQIFGKTPNVPFIPNRFKLLWVSGIIIAASLVSLFTRGLNFGTDFRGGTRLEYQFARGVSEGEVRKALQSINLGALAVVRFGDPEERRIAIKTAFDEGKEETLVASVTERLTEEFGGGVLLEKQEFVGPKVGKELRRKGLLTVLFSLFCMLVYVGFRFDFNFAPGALLALFHDVLVVLGVFSFFQFEFDLTVLAACLTVVGYSINDTIVIFDRVRENARLIRDDTVEEVVNASINETLSRTLMTSFTTFLVVLVLYLFGGATIKDFSMALLIGIVTGTYSTFSIACACYIGMYRHARRFSFWR